jgi:hypothetical protein
MNDLCYAVKVTRSAMSGYMGLAHKVDDGWESILSTRAYDVSPVFEPADWPYFVCATFRDGRHIPLPLILGEYRECGPLQRIMLKILKPLLQTAHYDCAHYDAQYGKGELTE